MHKLMFRGGILVSVMQYFVRSFALEVGNRNSLNLELQPVQKLVGRMRVEHTR